MQGRRNPLNADPLGGAMRGVTTHVLSFVAGALLAAVLVLIALSSRDSTATVILSNDTSTHLTNVRLHNRETGGTLIVDRLESGQTEALRVHIRGEGSYLLSATLPSGGLVEAERYMETGYTITEHIEPDQIRPEFTLY